jgi:RimJ/RimL family protein N-acetyltransferase
MTISLRPFRRSDFERLIAWSDSPQALRQWAGPFFSHPLDEGQLERYLRSVGPRRKLFMAVEEESGEAVGHAELDRIEPGRSAHVCRVIVAPERRGRGIGTALVEELRRFALDELGVTRLTLNVYKWNEPAIASYEKVGFRRRELHETADGDDWAYWSMELTASGEEAGK